MRRVLAVVALLGLVTCSEPDPPLDGVYRLTGTGYDTEPDDDVEAKKDKVVLRFTDLATGRTVERKVLADKAVALLAMMDVGRCYSTPMSDPKNEPCG